MSILYPFSPQQTADAWGFGKSKKPAPKKPVAKPAAKPGAKPAAKPAASKLKAPPGYNLNTHYGVDPTVKGGDGSLLGPLNLPKNLNAKSTFLWYLDPAGSQETPAQHPGFNTGDEGRQDMSGTMMTMAGGISYIRSLAVSSPKDYDAIVTALVGAGYLSASAARYGSYTMQVGRAFLQSAADVNAINADNSVGGAGGVVTWWDHVSALADGNTAAGLSLTGGGGSGSTPTRTDVYTNPEDVKAAVNNAAQSVLGRNLTDAEVAQFAGAFHGTEKTYNDQAWAQQQANANNAASAPDAVRAPSVSAAAQNYAQSSPALADDRTRQQLASYVQILRQMMGVPNSSGGVQNAYA